MPCNQENICVTLPFQLYQRIGVGGIFLKANHSTLHKINGQFSASHKEASKRALASIDKVIVYACGSASLWQNENAGFALVKNTPIIRQDDEYDVTKKVSHIPILIQTLLTLPDKGKELMNLRLDLESLGRDTTLTQNVTHQKIIDKSLRFLSEILPGLKQINSRKATRNYINSVKQELKDECKHAAEIQLHFLHKIIQDWAQAYSIDWKKSRIIVAGTHGPRKDMIEMQYLCKLFEHAKIKNPEDDWIYYAELLPHHLNKLDIKNDLIEQFLGGMEVNKSYGKSVWGNKKAMTRDILGKKKHASLTIQNLLPKQKHTLLTKQGLFQIKQSPCPMAKLKNLKPSVR